MNDLDVIAQLGDLKEIDYRNTLAIASIIELLIEKGVLSIDDIARKSSMLDAMTLEELKFNRLNKIQ